MNDWIVELETGVRDPASADDLDRFGHALDASAPALGAAASMNARTRVISATFTVVVSDPVGATEAGITIFLKSLEASGLSTADPTRVSVERLPLADALAV